MAIEPRGFPLLINSDELMPLGRPTVEDMRRDQRRITTLTACGALALAQAELAHHLMAGSSEALARALCQTKAALDHLVTVSRP